MKFIAAIIRMVLMKLKLVECPKLIEKGKNKNSELRQQAAFVSEHTIKCLLAFYDFFSPQGIFFSFSSDNHTQKQTDDNDRNDVEDNIFAKNDHVVMMMMMIVVTIGYETTSVQNMQ